MENTQQTPAPLFVEQFALKAYDKVCGEWHRSEFEALRHGAQGFVRHARMMNNGRRGYWYQPYPGVEVIKRTVSAEEAALAKAEGR